MGGPPQHQGPPVHMGQMAPGPPLDMRGPPMDMRGPHMGEPRNMMGDPRGPMMMEPRGPPMEARGSVTLIRIRKGLFCAHQRHLHGYSSLCRAKKKKERVQRKFEKDKLQTQIIYISK